LKEIDTHYKDWQRLAVNICKGDKYLADDLLHDTIARLIEREKFRELVDHGNLDHYMRLSLVRSYMFKNSSFNTLMQSNSIEFNDSLVDHLKAKTWIGARLDNEQIDIAINKLTFFQKEVFLLWSLEGFEYKELSDHTGIPIEDLYKATRQAKKHLRKWLIRTR
jgi:DNA-directed RNA polymerase specialized sigma24 family protein